MLQIECVVVLIFFFLFFLSPPSQQVSHVHNEHTWT